MSYDVVIFDPSTKAAHSSGIGLDEIDHAEIDESVRRAFVDRLEKYGYQRESGGGPLGRFVNTDFGIEVAVSEREISFTAPYGDAIFEALMTASELTDGDALALFDPQAGEWNE